MKIKKISKKVTFPGRFADERSRIKKKAENFSWYSFFYVVVW